MFIGRPSAFGESWDSVPGLPAVRCRLGKIFINRVNVLVITWLDPFILMAVFLASLAGVRHGMAAMVAMAAIYLPVMLAAYLLAPLLRGTVAIASDNPAHQTVGVYVIVASVGVVLAVLLTPWVERRLTFLTSSSPWIDRSAGGVLGLWHGLAVPSAIMTGFVFVAPPELGDYVGSGLLGSLLTGPFHSLLASVWLARP